MDGVVVESAGNTHWAWVGLRLVPAPTLAESRAYPDVEEPRLRAETSAAERAWLSALWTTEHGARWELRYTNGIPGRPVSCTLLGRVHGRDLGEVTAAAVALRDRLGRTPGHVRAEPILDTAAVRAGLAPTTVDPRGSAELRKPLNWAWCTRENAQRRKVCFTVTPLAPTDRSWEQVWHELARLPVRTTVGLYLEPYQPPDLFAVKLRGLVTEYGELATALPPNPMWNTHRPADPFAVLAAPNYLDATRRYVGRCYRLRISVAAEGPIDPSFAELLAATTGGTVACRIAPAELAAAWRQLASLDRGWLADTYRQGSPPGALSDVERILCDVVDPAEAHATIRLPYEIPGHLPLFTDPATSPHPMTVGGLEEAIVERPVPGVARKQVFVSYVREDSELVDRLVMDLRRNGYDVWIDRSHLLPGRRWKTEIKKAIARADYFVACFSPHSSNKDESYMNEELIIAVERFRLMPRTRDWFVSALMAPSDVRGRDVIPDHVFGVNETLVDDLEYADFHTNWDKALAQVVTLMGPPEKS